MIFQAILIVVIFVFCLFSGIPIGFSICIPAMTVMLINDLELMVAPQMITKGAQSFTLLAVPFFILAGNLMNSAGITRRIFNFCLALVGHIRGGLGHVNVLASMIFAGISGSAAADAAGLGKIEMKAMRDTGYDENFAAAVTAASSVIGPIIPPSIIMVIYATEANISVGNMFKAGLMPGILVGLALMATVAVMVARGEPTPPPAKFSLPNLLTATKEGILAVISPAIILLGMFSGSFSPTEAGVVAVVYSLLIGFLYKEISIKQLPEIFRESAITTAQCIFVTACATLLSWVVTFTRIPVFVSDALFSITDDKWVFLLLVNLFLLVLGCFMESIAGLLVILPIILPIALQLGIDPLHFGVICCYNMMIGTCTPPMGASIFIVCGIAETKFERVVKKIWPFVIAHIVALIIITYIPIISLWLPKAF